MSKKEKRVTELQCTWLLESNYAAPDDYIQ